MLYEAWRTMSHRHCYHSFGSGYGKDWNWELARNGGKIEDEEQRMHLSNWPIGGECYKGTGLVI